MTVTEWISDMSNKFAAIQKRSILISSLTSLMSETVSSTISAPSNDSQSNSLWSIWVNQAIISGDDGMINLGMNET